MFLKINARTAGRHRTSGPDLFSEKRDRSNTVVLFAYSILANVFFWSGLITPYGSGAGSAAFYTLVVIVLLGLTFASFGLAATISIVNRNKPNGSQGLAYVAGTLNFIVLLSTAGLSLAFLVGKGM